MEDYELKVLFDGYSFVEGGMMKANCSCTLIKGPINCVIDTMTAWDAPKLSEALQLNGLSPDDISYVICTHGHSDHVGGNHLFQKATHLVGFSLSQGDSYYLSPNLKAGESYTISESIVVIPTPGHTLQDVTVLFKDKEEVVYAITGDLFEKVEDLDDETLWIEAGSDDVELQRKNRKKILKMADYIVPGHGPMFKVPNRYK